MKRQVRPSPKRDLEETELNTSGNKRAKLLIEESEQNNHLEDNDKVKSLDHSKNNGAPNGHLDVPILSQSENAECSNISYNISSDVSDQSEMSSKINGDFEDSNKNVPQSFNNISCDESTLKISTDSSVTPEQHSNDPQPSNFESSEDNKPMPVLNAENLEIHNNESTDSFQSEGFETLKNVNESESKELQPPSSQEPEKKNEVDTTSLEIPKNFDIDHLTLSRLEVTQLEGHPDIVFSVAADEDIVLSSSGDTTVKVWSMVDKSLLCSFSGHKDSVTCMHLLSESQSETLKNKLQISEVSRIAVTGSLDCNIKLWSVYEGKELASVYTFNGITCLGFLESASFVVIGTEGGKLELWDLCTSKVVQSVLAHEDSVSDIKVHDCNVYSVATDGAVKVWLFEDGEMYPIYTRKRKERSSQDDLGPAQWKTVAVSGSVMYLGDNTSIVKVLDSVAGRLRLFRNQTSREGVCECVATDRDILLTSFYDSSGDAGGVNVWKIPDMTYICTLAGEVQDICSLAVVRKSGLLRIVTGGHQLLVWDFDFSKPPNKGSQDSYYISELEYMGHEIAEKTSEVTKQDTSLKESTSSSPVKSPHQWPCNVM